MFSFVKANGVPSRILSPSTFSVPSLPALNSVSPFFNEPSATAAPALKDPVGYVGGFTFTPSGATLLVRFETAHAKPTTANFTFEIRGPVAGYAKG